MQYATILDIDHMPWRSMGIAALQTFVAFWVAALGLKAVGRRTFGELGPQDVVLLILVSESLSIALSPPDAGFWGGLVSAVVLFLTAAFCERVRAVRRVLEGDAVEIASQGNVKREVMKKFLLDESDLDTLARTYGVSSPDAFERIVIEGDGRLTGVLRPEARHARKAEDRARL